MPGDLRAHALGGRFGRDERRERRLERDEPAEELVVLGVADRPARPRRGRPRSRPRSAPRARRAGPRRRHPDSGACLGDERRIDGQAVGREVDVRHRCEGYGRAGAAAIRHNPAMAIPEITTERLAAPRLARGRSRRVRGDERGPGRDGALPGRCSIERRATRSSTGSAQRLERGGLRPVGGRADGGWPFLGFTGLSRPSVRGAVHASGRGRLAAAPGTPGDRATRRRPRSRRARVSASSILGLDEIVSFTVPANLRSRRRDGAPRHDARSRRRLRPPAAAGRAIRSDGTCCTASRRSADAEAVRSGEERLARSPRSTMHPSNGSARFELGAEDRGGALDAGLPGGGERPVERPADQDAGRAEARAPSRRPARGGCRHLPRPRTAHRPPRRCPARTSALVTERSSCRPPWFETTIASTPASAASRASSAERMPLRTSGSELHDRISARRVPGEPDPPLMLERAVAAPGRHRRAAASMCGIAGSANPDRRSRSRKPSTGRSTVRTIAR